ncbi:MAG: outer-membrane lipoprotein carrier protein LolA [Magnetococcales bacterium]|nr:outer-membrane lipoprotein carrier protein LolA [Magnetococcales bacterium]
MNIKVCFSDAGCRVFGPYVALLIVICMAFPGVLQAQDQDIVSEDKEVVAPSHPAVMRLQRFIYDLKSMDATFVQKTDNADSGVPTISHGRFQAERPYRFRWDYTDPYPQLILSDSTMVWYYEEDLKQVTRTPAERLNSSPAAFLIAGRPLGELFRWEVLAGPKAGTETVRLHSLNEEESSFDEIRVTLHPERDELYMLEVMDNLGNFSRFTFDNMKMNQPIPQDRFHFTVPEGVDVLDG